MEPLLRVQGVSHRFGGLQALNAMSFDLFPGEILGLIGPNGAGKTSLFATITGNINPDRGQVLFQGRSIKGLAPETIARMGLMRTFQTPRPFPSLSFQENVMIGALNHTRNLTSARKEALRCLALVDLVPMKDTPAKGASTGQRKRLDIARALASRPQVLLLDEPLGGIDPGNIKGIIELLKSIRGGGVTLLVIEHNLEAVTAFVDRLMAMNLGQLLREGSPAEVTQDARVVQAYMGSEIDGNA